MPGVGDEIIVIPRARRHVQRAIAWYHDRNPHAALGFEDAFDEALKLLAEAPLRWAELKPGVRRFILPRHPYMLVYTIHGAQVTVLAVVHHARHPEVWRRGP